MTILTIHNYDDGNPYNNFASPNDNFDFPYNSFDNHEQQFWQPLMTIWQFPSNNLNYTQL